MSKVVGSIGSILGWRKKPMLIILLLSAAVFAQGDLASPHDKAEIIRFAEDWAAGWSSRDIDTYSSFYDSRAFPDWKAYRAKKQRIFAANKTILVTLNRIEVVSLTQNSAVVRFNQLYMTGKTTDRDFKELNLALVDGDWKITGETVIGNSWNESVPEEPIVPAVEEKPVVAVKEEPAVEEKHIEAVEEKSAEAVPEELPAQAAAEDEPAAHAGEDHAAHAAEEPVVETAEAEPQVPPAAEEPKTGGSNMFVFSVRPEFASGFKAMGAGASAEFGTILKKNLYLAGELNGGVRYYGIEANIGKYFGEEWGLMKNIFGDTKVKNVFGGSVGFRNTLLPVKFKENGQALKTEDGNNFAVAGGFWKIMFGGQHNTDITNKILLGYRKNPSSYDGTTVSYDKGFDMTYVLGIGYTLTKIKN